MIKKSSFQRNPTFRNWQTSNSNGPHRHLMGVIMINNISSSTGTIKMIQRISCDTAITTINTVNISVLRNIIMIIHIFTIIDFIVTTDITAVIQITARDIIMTMRAILMIYLITTDIIITISIVYERS